MSTSQHNRQNTTLMEIIKRLPVDIVRHIIPYTYECQPKVLLDDIQNYSETLAIIQDRYREQWVNFMGEATPVDRHWLANDIVYEANQTYPTLHGYTDDYYKLCFRYPWFKESKERVDRWSELLNEDDNLEKAIHLYWGIFTIPERQRFLSRTITP
jgi:hypothetical protein